MESWGEILKHLKIQHEVYSFKRNYPDSKYLHSKATTTFEVSLIKYNRKFFHIGEIHHDFIWALPSMKINTYEWYWLFSSM